MDVLTAIQNRRSVREYASRPIPPDVLGRLQTALRVAPSACNLQPWHFVWVADAALRERVAAACCDQRWMAPAPLIVVGCGLPEGAYKHMAGTGNSATIDVAIALDHLTLAAVAEGLGTCWIGAFDEDLVRDLLGIPATVRVVALTPVGYPARDGLLAPADAARRKPAAEIFSRDRYGQPLSL